MPLCEYGVLGLGYLRRLSCVTNRRDDYLSSPNWGATPASGSMPLGLIGIAPAAYASWVSGVTLGETRVLFKFKWG